MDFNLASKHKREVEQRRKEAKRKLEQQRREEEQQRAMEQDQRSREEARHRDELEARQRAEEEARLNEGVYFVAHLQPFPSARTDDKLQLPPSALEDLEKQGAIEKGTLLTFSVSLPGSAMGAQGSTHAGVAEFTAEEGTVGVPPRVALCLTRSGGLESLACVGQVEVRYVRLPRSSKSRVKFQPRGQGFHVGGMKTVQIDLEHTLMQTLRGHTALTVGDWLPIRHDGYTYELVVRELDPEPRLALLDTDLTVEVLPSEQTEAEARAEEERQAQEEAAVRQAEEQERLRLERARARALELDAEPGAGSAAVQLLVRLPSGGRLTRRFPQDARFEQVLVWVESKPEARIQPDKFRLVQKWPGHARELGPAESSETLGALGFGRQEALFLQPLQDVEVGDIAEEEAVTESGAATDGEEAAAPALPNIAAHGAWTAAEERAHEALDRRLARAETPTHALTEAPLEDLQGQELVGIFERLVALGMRPPQAAQAAKKFAPQLKELGEMGFEDWLAAVPLLERYGGRLVRVANLLSEGAGASDVTIPQAALQPVEAAQAQAPAAAPQPALSPRIGPAALPKEVVAAKFKELVAAGVQPNEAATRAIKEVRESLVAPTDAQQPATGEATCVGEVTGAGVTAMAVDEQAEKLIELASMGFVDEQRNRELLRKYAGRMERVVDALCNS